MKKSFLSRLRFLLNANVSRNIIPPLNNQFDFSFKHISTISTTTSLPDSKIVEIAKKEQRVIITHDLDYGEIYYLKERGAFGVIMLRLKNQSSENVISKLSDFFKSAQFVKINLSSSLVIISDKKIRVFSPEK